MFELMTLPFKENALEPHISEETISYHYGKHHRAYVNNLNQLIMGTDFQDMTLEEIIEASYDNPTYKGVYNNAGQVFNHNMYWNSIGFGKNMPAEIREKIIESFGSMDAMKEKLIDTAVKYFGSGWIWLVENKSGKMEIIATSNGETPLVLGMKPIFNLDVWEHAYYVDYRNNRKDYVVAFVEKLLKI